jgi:hypothetical protein
MAQELIVLALGMITQPNKMGQYPVGAMKFAQDVFIRSKGIPEVSRPAVQLQTVGATSSLPSEILVPSDVELANIFGNSGSGWSVQWFSSSTSNTVSIPFRFLGSGLTNYTRSRDRLLVASASGPIMFDFAAPTSTAQRTPRLVGLPAPWLTSHSVTGLTDNALKANTHASCVALIKRVYADGYELVSAVSLPSDSGFSSVATDIQHFVQWKDSPASVIAGDLVEIYRTRAQSSGIAGIGGVSCDATFFLTASHALSSGEASAGSVTINDSTPDTGIGRQLYTNPGIGGGQATYISPPVAPITCTFKGHSFLFNTTETAQIELQVLSGIGYAALADSKDWRTNIVGSREFTATWSNGSAVLTAISAAHMVGLRVGQNVRDDAVFGVHVNGMLITAIGASTVTIGGFNATGAGTKTFVAVDTMVVDGDTGSYSNAGGTGSAPSLSDLVYTLSQSTIAGVTYSTGRQSGYDSFQAQSLAYFSSTFLCSPTPSKFSIAKKRANPLSPAASPNITLTATNGQNYTPALPEFGSTPKTVTPVVSQNGMAWSEAQLPDAWPPANRSHVGSGRVLAAAATRDAVWLACTDGLWRLSGNGGAVGAEGYDWRLDLVDSTLLIAGPQAIAVLRDTVYTYSSRGFVSIDDATGIEQISEGFIGDLLPGANYTDTSAIEIRSDEDKDELWVTVGSAAYVWNYQTKTWVRSFQMRPTSSCTYQYWKTLNAIVEVDDVGSIAQYISDSGSPGSVLGTVTYQPVFGGDPFQTKQFIDVAFSFDPAVQPGTVVEFNDGTYGSFFTNADVRGATDRRIVYGVPRDAPAIAQAISVGLIFYGSRGGDPSTPRLWGMRLRFVPLGEQQTLRSPS